MKNNFFITLAVIILIGVIVFTWMKIGTLEEMVDSVVVAQMTPKSNDITEATFTINGTSVKALDVLKGHDSALVTIYCTLNPTVQGCMRATSTEPIN